MIFVVLGLVKSLPASSGWRCHNLLWLRPRGGRLPAQRAGQHHPGLTHRQAVTRGGLMNFDLDLKHTQWQPICKKWPKNPMCVYEKKFRDLLYALNFTLLTFYRCVWKEVEIWEFFTKSGLCSRKGMCDRREMSSINCELNKFSNILDVVSNWHKSTAASPQRELRAECCVWFLGVCPGWAGPPTHRCLCWLHLDSHQEYHDQAGTRGWHHCLLWHWGYYCHHHHQSVSWLHQTAFWDLIFIVQSRKDILAF